jgi:hypothetical protein
VRKLGKFGKMSEPLTDAILASILHLIWRDLTGNGRVPSRRAPLCWSPPRWAPTSRWRRCPCRSGPRVMTPPPQYRPMEPSPPRAPGPSLSRPLLPPFNVPYTPRSQVDLGQLTGPPEGITPFTVSAPRSKPTTEEQERGRQRWCP